MFFDLVSGYTGYHGPINSSDITAVAHLVPSEGYHSMVAEEKSSTSCLFTDERTDIVYERESDEWDCNHRASAKNPSG